MANVAAASNASSTVAARVTPAWRHTPSNTLSSAASAPVWLAAARGAALGGAALDDDERLARGHRGEAVEQAAAVGDALDVGQRHGGGRRRRRTSRGSRPTVDRGGVARRHGAADADAGLAGVVEEAADTKLPLWLATPIAPGRRVRRDDLRAQRAPAC